MTAVFEKPSFAAILLADIPGRAARANSLSEPDILRQVAMFTSG